MDGAAIYQGLAKTSTPNNIRLTHQLTRAHHVLPKYKLNFFYANVCSIRAPGRLDQLKDILKAINHGVDVIVLTETWLRPEDDVRQVDLATYKHYYNIRNDKERGGVSIFVKTHLRPRVTVSKYQGGVNYLWVHLETNNLNVGAVYRPGTANIQQFFEEYFKQLRTMQRAVVFGDFNIDLLKHSSNEILYVRKLTAAGYLVLNRRHPEYCTRKEDDSRTIIDHACTNLNSQRHHFHLAVVEKSMSDHNELYLGINLAEETTGIQEEVRETNSNASARMTASEDDSPPRDIRPRPSTSRNSRRPTTFDPDMPSTSRDRVIILTDDEEDDNDANDVLEVISISSDEGETEERNYDRRRCSTERETPVRSKKRRLPGMEFICKFCTCLYIHPGNYIKHLKKVHGYSGRIDDDMERKCPYCGVPLRGRAYNRHIRKVHGDVGKSRTAHAAYRDDDDDIVSVRRYSDEQDFSCSEDDASCDEENASSYDDDGSNNEGNRNSDNNNMLATTSGDGNTSIIEHDKVKRFLMALEPIVKLIQEITQRSLTRSAAAAAREDYDEQDSDTSVKSEHS